MILSFSFSIFPYQNAFASVCFNVSSSSVSTGSANNSYYQILNIALPNNGTFFTNNIRGFHPASQTDLNVFLYSQNGTHSFLFLPLIYGLGIGQQDTYCIYAGDQNKQNIQEIAPYKMAFNSESDLLVLSQTNTNSTLSWLNGIITVNAQNGLFNLYTQQAPAIFDSVEIYSKFARTNSKALNSSISGIFSGYNSSATNGFGFGLRNANFSAGWFSITPTNIYPNTTNYNIIKSVSTYGSTTQQIAIYNSSMSLLYSSNVITPALNADNLKYTNLIYVSNATANFDWSIAAKKSSSWSVSSINFDSIDQNINILTPTFNQIVNENSAVILRIQYLTSYDNCSLYVNNNSIVNYSTIAQNQLSEDIINNNIIIPNTNSIFVSCYKNSIESHRYWTFIRSGADARQLFLSTFNFDILNCPLLTQSELSKCNEKYKLTTTLNFSAIICLNLNLSKNFNCLNSISNYTKNNYTIYYSPSNFSYAINDSIQHMGANFIFSSAKIDGKIEIINSTRFIYIPAQNKDRDCGIYYNDPLLTCSWWDGFIINNKAVIISDKNNNWFITAGNGISPYDGNTSQLVINVPTVILVPTNPVSLQGVYTRLNCNQQGNTFIINILNTIQQNYYINVFSNNSFNYNISSSALIDNISLVNVSSITVSDGFNTICRYDSTGNLFLPFNISFLNIQGFDIIVKVMMLFFTILTSLIPFALFVLVILNDAYHIVSTNDIVIVAVFGFIAGFVNNSFSIERGIKHLIVIVAILIAYLMILNGYYELGMGNLYNQTLLPIEKIANSAQEGNLIEFIANTGFFIVDIFLILLTLPSIAINLIINLITVISPIFGVAILKFKSVLIAGFYIYVIIKGYEVIANRFRGV